MTFYLYSVPVINVRFATSKHPYTLLFVRGDAVYFHGTWKRIKSSPSRHPLTSVDSSTSQPTIKFSYGLNSNIDNATPSITATINQLDQTITIQRLPCLPSHLSLRDVILSILEFTDALFCPDTPVNAQFSQVVVPPSREKEAGAEARILVCIDEESRGMARILAFLGFEILDPRTFSSGKGATIRQGGIVMGCLV